MHQITPAGGAAPVRSRMVVCLSMSLVFYYTQSRLCNVYYYGDISLSKLMCFLFLCAEVKCHHADVIYLSYYTHVTHIFQSVLRTPVRLQQHSTAQHHCLQVTNMGLAEFTPDHALSVQLVATLVMTSPRRTAIGPETSHTCPIACRCSDVSRARYR